METMLPMLPSSPATRPCRAPRRHHGPGRALVAARRLASWLISTLALLLSDVAADRPPEPRPRTRGASEPGRSMARAVEPYQVFIKTLNGRTAVLQVPDGTLGGLKRALAARVGIPPPEQRLTYAGRDLGDDALLLTQYGVPRSATLHLSLRLRGGLPWGRLLMLVQAFQMVWPTVREWIRACWNACVKEENQCPVRPSCTRTPPTASLPRRWRAYVSGWRSLPA
jgi:ubiquitin-like protein Nedd8